MLPGFSLAQGVGALSDASKIVTWSSIVMAFGVSCVVGLGVATCSAIHAAHLGRDPFPTVAGGGTMGLGERWCGLPMRRLQARRIS